MSGSIGPEGKVEVANTLRCSTEFQFPAGFTTSRGRKSNDSDMDREKIERRRMPIFIAMSDENTMWCG